MASLFKGGVDTAARLVHKSSHLVPGKLWVSELLFEVPLDYSSPTTAIKIFARSVERYEKPVKPTGENTSESKPKPWFVYLQGGPGFGSFPPQDFPMTNIILDKGYQILYLDQRGTGLSSTVTAQTLALQGDAESQANYLKHFRADSIVRDCEAIRQTLTEKYPEELKKWSVFGQSFGGFCSVAYLSQRPAGLREVFLSGGLPPIGKTIDQVYTATFAKVAERNQAYYKKFPQDEQIVHNLAVFIEKSDRIELPSGATLTMRSFLSIGIAFGAHGGIDRVHQLVLRMKLDMDNFGFFTHPTLNALESVLTFDNNIIYALLHEACYCEETASFWSAERVGCDISEFAWLSDTSVAGIPDKLFFSGEMVFKSMFECSRELSKVYETAKILANFEKWPILYDQQQLAKNEVPVYAATYIEDMYVDYKLSQDTAKMIKGCKQHITNTLYHDAIRSNTADILKQLFNLRDDAID